MSEMSTIEKSSNLLNYIVQNASSLLPMLSSRSILSPRGIIFESLHSLRKPMWLLYLSALSLSRSNRIRRGRKSSSSMFVNSLVSFGVALGSFCCSLSMIVPMLSLSKREFSLLDGVIGGGTRRCAPLGGSATGSISNRPLFWTRSLLLVLDAAAACGSCSFGIRANMMFVCFAFWLAAPDIVVNICCTVGRGRGLLDEILEGLVP